MCMLHRGLILLRLLLPRQHYRVSCSQFIYMNFFSKSVLVTLFILGIFIFPSSSFAYTRTKLIITAQNDFVVEPGKTEIFINPGETVTKNITITNRIDKTVKFKLTTEDMTGTDDPQSPIQLLGDERGPYSLKDLII